MLKTLQLLSCGVMSVNKEHCKPGACGLKLLILDDSAWLSSCAPHRISTSLNQI